MLSPNPVLCTLFWHVSHSIVATMYMSVSLAWLCAPSGDICRPCFQGLQEASYYHLHYWQTTVYLCSEGRCRLSPCQHGCDQIHDSVTAMSLGDLQTVRWFGMSQERGHTHLLGKIYLSAEEKEIVKIRGEINKIETRHMVEVNQRNQKLVLWTDQ